MAVLCAWASANEYGKTTGGKAGDQTGKEVKCGNIYNFGQTRVCLLYTSDAADE